MNKTTAIKTEHDFCYTKYEARKNYNNLAN